MEPLRDICWSTKHIPMWVLPFPCSLYWAFSSVESEAREKEAKAKEKDKRNEA